MSWKIHRDFDLPVLVPQQDVFLSPEDQISSSRYPLATHLPYCITDLLSHASAFVLRHQLNPAGYCLCVRNNKNYCLTTWKHETFFLFYLQLTYLRFQFSCFTFQLIQGGTQHKCTATFYYQFVFEDEWIGVLVFLWEKLINNAKKVEKKFLKPHPILINFIGLSGSICDRLRGRERLLWHTLSIGWELDAARKVCQVLKAIDGFTLTHKSVITLRLIRCLEKYMFLFKNGDVWYFSSKVMFFWINCYKLSIKHLKHLFLVRFCCHVVMWYVKKAIYPTNNHFP